MDEMKNEYFFPTHNFFFFFIIIYIKKYTISERRNEYTKHDLPDYVRL